MISHGFPSVRKNAAVPAFFRMMEFEDEDLSDVQIDILLKSAERQLQHKPTEQQDDSLQSYLPKPAKLALAQSMLPYVDTTDDIARVDAPRLVENEHRISSNAARKIEDPVVVKDRKLKDKKATAGADWYNMPRTNLTPELKRDLQLIQMRSVLDPKRFYKKENTRAKPPEFSQVGTVVEGPTEFYSSRIPKRERHSTLAEEVLAGEHETGKFRKKYLEIQAAKTSGRKAHYKARMAKRYGKRYKG